MNSDTPRVSFIGIVDFTEEAKWLYCSESVSDLLGFEPHELIGTPSLNLVHPDEFTEVKSMHYSTITQDRAAVLAYLRMKHKDPYKGYILCAISRTVCQNVLVGSVSYASPGPKAMHNASTAQEVRIITPSAKDFEFRRWNDPNPMPPCPVPNLSRSVTPTGSPSGSRSPSPSPEREAEAPEHFDPLPEQSPRTALFLDRFSLNCPILYCSNDSILQTTHVLGRSFFDFVMRSDEDLVRSWIDVIKSWGVNERGQPSDGGFGFGKFKVCVEGRDSSERPPDPAPSRRGHQSNRDRERGRDREHDYQKAHRASHGTTHDPSHGRNRRRGEPQQQRLVVDAIFSAHSDGLMVIIRKSES
ncbi:uncharacterized protein LAESUDRAFT_754395 [Laetiporus sulphureus 93-53]|uniref:PAS domain-containing protein n=1 Tax=Laetiporus sulphureus 93-53 TaxID=1314785 RepID=A0A165HKE0_9APHY|nr:uncharacterized protein LAESUDRAFT_754395 [Laetiporus sulphureus 93-53]KZT11845.1 hypothetical protein LAESUDRAFT_754395 [Laetiporus sulphureus 93-53]